MTVLVRFKQDITEDQKQAWQNAHSALATKIPSGREVRTGKKIPSAMDKGWDDGRDQASATIGKLLTSI